MARTRGPPGARPAAPFHGLPQGKPLCWRWSGSRQSASANSGPSPGRADRTTPAIRGPDLTTRTGCVGRPASRALRGQRVRAAIRRGQVGHGFGYLFPVAAPETAHRVVPDNRIEPWAQLCRVHADSRDRSRATQKASCTSRPRRRDHRAVRHNGQKPVGIAVVNLGESRAIAPAAERANSPSPRWATAAVLRS